MSCLGNSCTERSDFWQNGCRYSSSERPREQSGDADSPNGLMTSHFPNLAKRKVRRGQAHDNSTGQESVNRMLSSTQVTTALPIAYLGQSPSLHSQSSTTALIT